MNLDELRSVRRTERQKDSLQHLRDSFYEDAARYVEQLKAQREQAAEEADDPFSAPEVGQLTDEIETAEEVVEAIYERRVGKVVKQASFAAADMPTDEEGLTREERRLFGDLVDRIKGNRQTVLDMLAGETPPGSTAAADEADTTAADPDSTAADPDATAADPDSTAADPDAAVAEPDAGAPAADPPSTPLDAPPQESTAADPDDVLSEAMGGGATESSGDADPDGRADPDGPADLAGGGPEGAGPDSAAPPETPPDEPLPSEEASAGSDSPTAGSAEAAPSGGASSTGDGDRATVRITADVGRILGVDEREYDLAREDVVTLPETNAAPLVERDAAERLD